MAHDFRPQLKRWCLDQRRIERDIVEIVVQKGTPAAMARVARHTFPWVALAPVADAADLVTGRIGQENVGSAVPALSMSLQLPSRRRQLSEIRIIVYGNQHVRVLRIGFVCRQGTDQRNAPHTGKEPCALDKLPNFGKQKKSIG
jgi:hypothetical protein